METKKIYIGYYLHILVAIFFFFIGVAKSQDFITTENFEDKIAKDIVAVEFWVEWNKTNIELMLVNFLNGKKSIKLLVFQLL